MAATTKKRTTRTSSSSKAGTSRKKNTHKNTAKQEDLSAFHDEVVILLSTAVMAILVLSNFSLCGKVGNLVSSVFFGIFGGIQYILPVAVFFCIALLISNHYNSLAVKKVCIGIFLAVMIATLLQMFIFNQEESLFDIYRNSSQHKTGGGIIGGMVCIFLHKYLGSVGTYILLSAAIIICLVLITETSFLNIVKKGSSHVYENVKETGSAVAERRKDRLEERRARRQEQQDLFAQSLVLPDEETKEAMEVKEVKKPRVKKQKEKQAVQDVRELAFEIPGIDPDTGEILPRAAETFSEQQDTLESEIFPIQKEELPVSTESVILEKAAESVFSEAEVFMKEEPEEHKIEPEVIHPKAKGPIAKEQSEVLDMKVASKENGNYKFPPMELLTKGDGKKNVNQNELKATALKLQQTLENFGVGVTITNVSQGPAVTRYEMQPEQGVKVSKIVGLADDIKLNLAAADIRIEAPIPGKAAIGIEVPNKTNSTVMYRDLIESEEFEKFPSELAFAVGKDIGGKVIVADIAKMPHLLIAGATGSGKSVCINTLIMSILYKAKPSDVRLIMIDPKVVELSTYNGIPHLLIPVVTDPKKASGALNWAVMEMTDRYKKFAEYNVRNLKGYNKKVEEVLAENENLEEELTKLPQIVIIVDELADLMMVAPGEVEDAIVRLSQLARAAGIHLVIATQRPSVNVITGLIKANVPSRIAFSVSSGVDSRTIIDMNGAEKLLGKGDMLFYPSGYQKPVRVQGAFISDKEVSNVVEFLKEQGEVVEYNEAIAEQIGNVNTAASAAADRDEYFVDAGRFIIEKDKASIGMLQRFYKIGFNRAARIMDQLAEAGVVGPEEGTKPRKVLMSEEEFEQFIEECV